MLLLCESICKLTEKEVHTRLIAMLLAIGCLFFKGIGSGVRIYGDAGDRADLRRR